MLLQTTSSFVSAFLQQAAVDAIYGDEQPVRAMMDEYKARRDLLVSALNDIPGISYHLPGGAFYAFPDISSFGLCPESFADVMLYKAGVALLPDSNFCARGEVFIRICYASYRAQIPQSAARIADTYARLK